MTKSVLKLAAKKIFNNETIRKIRGTDYVVRVCATGNNRDNYLS